MKSLGGTQGVMVGLALNTYACLAVEIGMGYPGSSRQIHNLTRMPCHTGVKLGMCVYLNAFFSYYKTR